jgi:hypothetical protein
LIRLPALIAFFLFATFDSLCIGGGDRTFDFTHWKQSSPSHLVSVACTEKWRVTIRAQRRQQLLLPT